jgi:LPS export ABC transporter protein LptC
MKTRSRLKSVCFLITALFGFLVSCTNDIKQIKAFEEEQNLPVMNVDTLQILYSDSAKLKIKLLTNKLLRYSPYDKPYMVFPEGIKVYFYNRDEKLESSLIANYAHFNEKTEIWEARGNVVIVNRDGDVITTPQVFWDRRKAKVYSEKEVRIRKKDEIINGIGFDADQNFYEYTIWKFRGVISLNAEPTDSSAVQ